MDLRKLKTLIDLVSESNVSELEITEAEGKVRIVKSPPPAPVVAAAPAVTVAPAAAPAAEAQPVEATPATPTNDKPSHSVKSPMVGTFYRSPNPESAPFVDVGSKVNVGDRLCIVEAMKILNEIESDKAGVITAIHLNDGDPVEYGQVMFSIE